MQANQRSLQDLLSSAARFVIPEYQRPYCWTKEEVEQLWNDLFEAFEDAGKTRADAEDDPDEYFLGSFVVAKRTERGGSVAYVVDGQQRLTTLHAMLWAALPRVREDSSLAELAARLERLLKTPSGRASLGVASDDQANFTALQTGAPADETRDLGATASYMRKSLAAIDESSRVAAFLEFVLDRTSFILVETESYASAWDLFIGLNGKGRPLNPADLIKAFVCGNTVDSSAMADIWKDKVLPLDGDATSALLDVTRVATGEVGSEAKLFKSFERAWGKQRVTPSLLGDGCMVYQRVWRAPAETIRALTAPRSLRGLRSLERRDHTPLMLALGARYGADAPFRSALLRALEGYQLAMAVRSKRGRERDFTLLAASINADAPTEAEALRRSAALLRRLAPPRDEVLAAIKSLSYPGRHMKLVVTQFEEGLRGDVQIADVQYEHMMPKTPTEYWYGMAGTRDANAYARVANNIGNIAPLDSHTNIVGSNDDWATKTGLYTEHVPNWLVAGIAKSNPDGWTPTKINARAAQIAEWAVTRRWPLEDALRELES